MRGKSNLIIAPMMNNSSPPGNSTSDKEKLDFKTKIAYGAGELG